MIGDSASSVRFLALETYRFHGGIQRFNRRVIAGLSRMAENGQITRLEILIKGDRPADVPAGTPAVKAYGERRLGMVRDAIASTGADVIFVGHINLLPLAVLAKLASPRTRLVLFVHGDEVWNEPQYRSRRWFEPALLRRVARLAAVSRFTARIMARAFDVPDERFVHFPNATDVVPQAASAAGLRDTILTVTRVGIGDRQKNVDKLIRAFAAVAHRMPGAALEIVGEGVLLDELKALSASLGVAARVRFLGAVSDAELDAAYARARLFALPSDKEGFGIVYLEAWQHGVPVICSCEGAPSEIVEDGVDGWVIDPADADRFAATLVEAFNDPRAAAAMGAAGRDKVARLYSGEAFEARLAALVAEAAAA